MNKNKYESMKEVYWSASSFYFCFGLVIGLVGGVLITLCSRLVVR